VEEIGTLSHVPSSQILTDAEVVPELICPEYTTVSAIVAVGVDVTVGVETTTVSVGVAVGD